MSDKIKYIFLTIGIAAIIVMCLTFDVSFADSIVTCSAQASVS